MRSRAFTLLETVVTLGLATVMMLILAGLAHNFYFAYSYQQEATQAASGASRVVGDVEASVRPASQVLASYTPSGTTYHSGAGTLVLSLPAVDSSGNAIADKSDYAVFYTNGSNAYRLMVADAASSRVSGTTLLSGDVLALSFTFDSVDFTQVKSVGIDVQTETKTKQETVDEHRYELVYLRNH